MPGERSDPTPRSCENERVSPITGDYNRPAAASLAVRVRYSVPRPEAVLLEGSPVTELVARALHEAGLRESDEARLVLAVNAPGAAPVAAAEQPHRDVETHDRDLEAFARTLEGDARDGREIALADVAYEGGLEKALARLVDAVVLASRLRHVSSGERASLAILEAALALHVLASGEEAAPPRLEAAPPSGPGPGVDAEIAEQPLVLERLLARPSWDDLARRVAARAPEGVVTVARGSSDHAATYFGYLVWTLLERPAASLPPSVATVFGKSPRGHGRLAVGISQSGESPDVVRGLEAARAGGAYALAVTNVAGSSLARAADETIELGCGPERAVAATKTFTASLAALLALTTRWAGRSDLVAALARVPEAAARALAVDVGPAVERLAAFPSTYVLGRGHTLAIAEELALKLKEVARVHAEALSTHEFRHGPVGSLEPGTPVVVVLPPTEPLRSHCREVGAWLEGAGASVVWVGERAGAVRPGDVALDVGLDLPNELAPLVQTVALQRIAVGVARARGLDPDRPKNITKVTRTW